MTKNPATTVGMIEVRIRYCECDPMGVGHHSAYLPWLEMGRTELLRQSGLSYLDLEARGIFLAVTSVTVHYKRPARYDDLIQIHTTLREVSHVRIEHEYELTRGGELLATASTTLACLDADGRPRAIPDEVRRRAGGRGSDGLTEHGSTSDG